MATSSPIRRQKLRVSSGAQSLHCPVLFLWVACIIATATLIISGVQSALAAAAAAATAASQEAAQLPVASQSRQNYFGTFIGKLTSHPKFSAHGVSGEVYAVDEQTLFIRNFNYDGQAPDAYFWSSVVQPAPAGQDGFIVPDEKGSTKPLERYANKDVVLRLPEGKTLREIHWLSVWSRALRESVGEIMLHRSSGPPLVIPRPLETTPLSQLAHGLRSGPITIVDAQTLLVPDFHYDGLGPDAYFWLTRGTSGLGAANSLKLRDENGGSGPLRRYSGETIVISLPDEFTIYDFNFFGVWCRQFAANFGQVQLPRSEAAVVPPSPKMLGIKPENKLNCEILYDDLGFEIRWVLDGDDIVMQLVGKIEPGEYMAFGLGKDDSRSDMNGADAVVAWVDRPTGQVHATDYYLGSKAQCVNDPQQGSCPDVKLANGSDSLTLLHGAIVNGYSMVTFKRPQLGVDDKYDQHVYSDGQQSVIWAVGVLNKVNEIGYHRLRTKTNMFIDFARNPQWNCPIPDLNASMHGGAAAAASTGAGGNNLPITSASQVDQTIVSAAIAGGRQQGGVAEEPNLDSLVEQPLGDSAPVESAGRERQLGVAERQQQPWFIPQVVCPQDRTFHAQIGPTAGKRGYAGLTGRTSWVPPVSWYINGLLVPELVVERGQVYRFIVEGGNDKKSASRRHPLYLTDSPEGGFDYKTDDERMRERIFGGVAMRASDGQFVPTAEGHLCEWKQTNATLADPDLYPTFSSYQRSLKLDCLPGQASILKFVPDINTPDQIYYQCYTNRFMGWRVRVVNSCQAYISSQLSQLKQQQQAAAAAATAASSSTTTTTNHNFRRDLTGSGHKLHTTRARDTLNRRQSSGGTAVDLIDLKGQASEQRMLAFEQPPPGLMSSTSHEFEPTPADELNLLQAAAAASGGWSAEPDFGDEFAASEEFHRQTGGGGPLLLNNASLLRTGQQAARGGQFNMSSIEQILRLPPGDLEFLDDSQLDLASAVALASASSNSQPQHSPVPIPLQHFLASQALQQQQQQQGHNATAAAQQASRGGAKLVPKSLHAYMRRLASIYYPMQQQLASMLSIQSPGAHQQSSVAQLAAAEKQRQQQMLAALHQQIVAASTAVPPTINKPNLQVMQMSNGEPATAASAPSTSFSLASLMPKSKIDLSKSNLSKKLSKLRIKSGRKYEPQQQQQQASGSSPQGKLQPRPPTPDNEFNYDIFNSQLAQLEKQQKQFQSMESFAAAMAGANSPLLHQLPGQVTYKQQVDSSFNYLPMMSAPNHTPTHSSVDPEQSLMFASASPFESHQQQQQQQQDPLQLQQQTLNFDILKNFRPPSGNQQQLAQQHHPDDRNQQAVFVTKLPQQTIDMATGQPIVDSSASGGGGDSNTWPSQQQERRPTQEHGQQQQQQTRPHPSYLDSTDYGAQRHRQHHSQPHESSEGHSGAQSAPTGSDQKSNQELLSGSDGTNHYLVRQHEQGMGGPGMGGDLDHMLAIERYSKQSSERRPPSIVHPITGEQVYEQQQQVSEQIAQNYSQLEKPPRFSSKLIDKNIVEPTPSSDNALVTVGSTMSPIEEPQHRAQAGTGGREIMDTEQSVQAADLRRLVASSSVTSDRQVVSKASDQPTTRTTTAASSSTTDVPHVVMLRPTSPSSLDFFSPLATTTPTSIIRTPTPTVTFQPPTTTSGYAPGPLVPSMGPPKHQPITPTTTSVDLASADQTGGGGGGELIFKSNLIEPIKSTLIPTSSNLIFNNNKLPSQFNIDFSPFTPIELSSSPFGSAQQHLAQNHHNHHLFGAGNSMAPAASNLLATRLRPPPFIESMLSQWTESSTRPEPPVRVASYLAQQLQQNNQNSKHLQRVAPEAAGSQEQQQQVRVFAPSQTNNSQPSPVTSKPDLIILKPAMLNSNGPRTFGLRPQYLTTAVAAEQPPESGGGLFYGNSLSSELASLHAAGSGATSSRRLAGHQFDRLSSLSSPPSTSMVRTVDPMQASNSDQSQHFRPSKIEQVASGSPMTSTVVEPQVQQGQNSSHSAKSSGGEQQATSKHNKLNQVKVPSLSIGTEDSGGQPKSPSSAGGEFNILQRDNSTDNAILTHVMSLIAAHAVPTPPLIPLASAYSSADYFLPISDHQHTPTASHTFRARSIRT